MKVGDLVRVKNKTGDYAIVVSEVRHGINVSFVDVLLKGKVICLFLGALEVINENR